MTLATTTQQDAAAAMERVLIVGDLAKLSPQERVNYYMTVCDSLGLNPSTRPFDYITFQGKMTLYARRDAVDQLRRRDRISITITSRERMDDIYTVMAKATTPDGRTDEATGAVAIGGLKGDNLANAIMKAETKAKRRVTLSICGLGWTDESETETIPGARRVQVNDQGEIIDAQYAPVPEPAKPAMKPNSQQAQSAAQPAQSAKATTAKRNTINEAQRKLLYALANNNLVPDDAIKAYLQEKHGVTSSKDLDKAQFNDVKAWLERGGDLSDPVDAEVVEWDENAEPQPWPETFGDQAGPLPLG